jgi:NAD-dependent deacetylase
MVDVKRMRPDKIVILSSAGISAESGLPTFRDADGLWRNHDWRELAWTRGTSPRRLRRRIDAAPIHIGDLCDDGTQLRPDIVWFGEDVPMMAVAARHVSEADKVLVVGTSLSVYPAASLTRYANPIAEKVVCAFEVDDLPWGFRMLRGKATEIVPGLVREWLAASVD